MIDYLRSRVSRVHPHPLNDDGMVYEEGMCLVFTPDSGDLAAISVSQKADPEDVYAGSSFFERRAPAQANRHESFTTPDDPDDGWKVLAGYVEGTASLHVDEVLVPWEGSGLRVSNDGLLSWDADGTVQPGTSIDVFYRASLTVTEAAEMLGSSFIETSGLESGASVEVITAGTLFTTMFDPASAWTFGDSVKVGRNGLYTTGGNGRKTGGFVIAPPSSGDPAWVGLQF